MLVITPLSIQILSNIRLSLGHALLFCHLQYYSQYSGGKGQKIQHLGFEKQDINALRGEKE